MNWRWPRTRRRSGADKRRLLVLDTSYTWNDAQARNAQDVFLYRDLDGYFNEVWSVHPFAGNPSSRTGRPLIRKVSARHVVVDGGTTLPSSRSIPEVAIFSFAQIRLIWLLLVEGRFNRFCSVRAGDPLYLGALGYGLSRLLNCPLTIRVSGNFDEIRDITQRPIMPKLFPSIAQERRVEKWVLEHADWVFAPNINNLRFALNRGAKSNSTSIVRYGSVISSDIRTAAESKSESALNDQELIGDQPFVLVVSRLEPVKQVDHALRAFAIAAETHPEIELWIAGEGSHRSDLEILSCELGIQDRVRFWGNMDQRWLAQAYRSCRVYLSPQSGRALSEAALMGVAIVGYDRDWQSEIVNGEDVGILVSTGDWAALGKALEWVLINEDAAREMGESVRTRALHLLNPETALNAETAIYEQLPKRRR